jgi:TetR/AcrR family transcriptional repressor of nem operon
LLPALGAEIARADSKTRKAFTACLEDMVDVVAGEIQGLAPKAARQRGMAIVAVMMGSLLLSRATGNSEMSSDLLEAGRQSALALGKKADNARRPARQTKVKARTTARLSQAD